MHVEQLILEMVLAYQQVIIYSTQGTNFDL